MPTTPRHRPAARAPRAVQFDPLVPQPAYGRVAAAIEQKILDRSLRPGDPLPTETELAAQFAVNRSTVREALRRLESAGLVARVRSDGDRRKVGVVLTPEGERLVRRIRARRTTWLTRRLEGLDHAEREHVAAALPALRLLVGSDG